jgi:hypothetical protein
MNRRILCVPVTALKVARGKDQITRSGDVKDTYTKYIEFIFCNKE